MLEKIFHLKENHTDVKTELMAGVTTFMTMAYILAVNPSILSASGMDANAVLIATSLASFVGTALMALLANYPFALAPGMGLNAYFSYTVVLTMGYSWQLALMAVFVEGIIFIVLSLTNVREAIFNAIPHDPEERCQRGHRPVRCFRRPAERKADREQRFYPRHLSALQGRDLPQHRRGCDPHAGGRAHHRHPAGQKRSRAASCTASSSPGCWASSAS